MRRKILYIFGIVFVLIASSFFVTAQARADDDGAASYGKALKEEYEQYKSGIPRGKSIRWDFFMPIFNKTISDMHSPFELDSASEAREMKNNAVFFHTPIEKDGTTYGASYYSLYDLFGPNISFVKYYGEESIKTGFIDKIYATVMEQNATEETGLTGGVKSIMDFLGMKDISFHNQFYDGRPEVGNDTEVDPRVKIYHIASNTINASGGDNVGNFYLNIAKTLTDITCFFVGNTLPKEVHDVVVDFFSEDKFAPVRDLLNIVFTFIAIALIFFLISSVWKIVKGKKSFTEFTMQLASSIISLVMIVVMLASPVAVVNVSWTVITFADTLIADAFNHLAKATNNDVVASDSLDNVLPATLWYESIFTPWCKATFNDKTYQELFTQHSDKATKLDQNESSKNATGDISVPTGVTEDHNIKNWAALAYSCLSDYHQDAAGLYDNSDKSQEDIDKEIEDKDIYNDKTDVRWPNPGNKTITLSDSIYKDDFRWIDALLNVGEHLNNDANATTSYQNYNSVYSPKIVENGWDAVWRSVFLIPVLMVAFLKFIVLLKALFAVARLFFNCFQNALRPTAAEYNVLANLKSVLNSFLEYYLYAIYLAIIILLYISFVGTGIFGAIIFVFIGTYVVKTKPKDVAGSIKNGINSVRGTASRAKGTAKGFRDAYRNGQLNSLENIANRMEEQNNPYADKELRDRVKDTTHQANSQKISNDINTMLASSKKFPKDKECLNKKPKDIAQVFDKEVKQLSSGIKISKSDLDRVRIKENLSKNENFKGKKDFDDIANECQLALNKWKEKLPELDDLQRAKSNYQQSKAASKEFNGEYKSDEAKAARKQDLENAKDEIDDAKQEKKDLKANAASGSLHENKKTGIFDSMKKGINDTKAANDKIKDKKNAKKTLQKQQKDAKKANKLEKKVAKTNLHNAQMEKIFGQKTGFKSVLFKMQLAAGMLLGFVIAWLALTILAWLGII